MWMNGSWWRIVFKVVWEGFLGEGTVCTVYFLFGMYSEIEEEDQFFELHDPTSRSCRMK